MKFLDWQLGYILQSTHTLVVILKIYSTYAVFRIVRPNKKTLLASPDTCQFLAPLWYN